ncbi:adhesion G-protein coupled receptor G5-like [Myxocyprinus asiaticus]|uniref:adhesion G-protein coupled receptor G5-like n=1 Tax=Myxocyprinus asiaticus TaxID=70543 RepID=UPI0022212B5C|nr:adhesion G-protein coupled receptor G5-like [Myxocyprinus asiaticus]
MTSSVGLCLMPQNLSLADVNFSVCELQTRLHRAVFILYQLKMGRVQDMTVHVLLLIIIYGMGGPEMCNGCPSQWDKILPKISDTSNKQTNTEPPMTKNPCNMNKDTKSPHYVNEFTRCLKAILNKLIETDFCGPSKDYNFEQFSMRVVKIKLTDMAKGVVPITAPKVNSSTQTAQIWIPEEAFQNVSEDQHKVGVVTYESDEQFKLGLGNSSIASNVIRIEIPGREFVNLTRSLKILFPVNNYTNYTGNYNYSCQFYDETVTGNYTWKTDGCTTIRTNNNLVECLCDHMTAFAVLLIEMKDVDKNNWEILSYISYIGSSLSAFFSACAILSYIVNSNTRIEVSSSIHVSLSGALLLLNISFMLSEWAATLTNGVCVFVAVVIHYSLLCCFSWMAIEALHLYLLLARVFNIYIKHYMLKLSLIGWGIPALLVGGLLTVHDSHHFYGTKEVKLLDTNTTKFCWITEPVVLYGVNLCYFSLVFLFNSLILVTVSREILKLKHLDNKQKKRAVCKDASTVLGLMCLLGTSWGLVFFSTGYTNYPILYLFCILNTMQGFSIFLWICRTARPDKQQVTRTESLSTVDTSTTDKYKKDHKP